MPNEFLKEIAAWADEPRVHQLCVKVAISVMGPLTVIEAGFELLPISRGFSGANDLDCGRAS